MTPFSVTQARRAILGLSRTPGFSFSVVLALGLGIGATSTAFSVVNAVLLRSLPYEHPEELFGVEPTVSFSTFKRWEARLQGAAGVAAFRPARVEMTVGNVRHRNLVACIISPHLFDLLGAHPHIGPSLSDYGAGVPAGVALSDATWREFFDANPGVVGKSILINNSLHTVTSVMPAWFAFPDTTERNTAIWLTQDPASGQDLEAYSVFKVLVRVRPPASAGVVKSLTEEMILPTGATQHLQLVRLTRTVRKEVRLGLLLCSAAAVVLLMLSCSAAAGLYLARTAKREEELAIRLALGASWGFMISELLVEIAVITCVAGIIGLFLAQALLVLAHRWLLAILPGMILHAGAELYVCSLAVAASTGAVCILAPLQRLRSLDASSILQSSAARGSSVSSRTFQKLLVGLQTAVTLTMLIGTTLLLRTIWQLWSVPLGFDSSHLLVLSMDLPRNKYPDPKDWSYGLMRAEDILKGVSGVSQVGGTNALPFWGYTSLPVRVNASAPVSLRVWSTFVTPTYLSTMRIRLGRGRSFAQTDTLRADRVVIVDSLMARTYWPNSDALNQDIAIGVGAAAYPAKIVGICDSIHQASFAEAPHPTIYLPYAQAPASSITFVLRTNGEPSVVAKPAIKALERLDSYITVNDVNTMRWILSSTIVPQEASAFVLGVLGGVAFITALLGVYGLVTYSVKQRTREIGIRLAVGSTGSQVSALIVRQTLWPVVAGITFGLIASGVCFRLVASLLFGVTSLDVPTFAGSAALVFGSGLVAGRLAVAGVSRMNPIAAMRHD